MEMVLGSESAETSLPVDRKLTKAETGGLFRIAVKLMMARSDNDVLIEWSSIARTIADATSDYIPLVNLISVFFQIRDDYMNLQSAEVSSTPLSAIGSFS